MQVLVQSASSQSASYPVKAKFHYAILVADRSDAGRRPVAELVTRASSLLAST